MRETFIRATILLVRITHSVSSLLPLRRRVVLATTHSSRIRGDLACIRRELRARAPGTPIVELIHHRTPGLRGRFRAVLQAMHAAYHLATARVFLVDSHFLPLYVIRRRPGTTVVQTWHACGAIKKIGYSALDGTFGADEAMVNLVRIHSNYDLCLAASAAAVEQYVDAFRQPPELFRTDLGVPRTDVLAREAGRDELAAGLRSRYQVPSGRKVILYAPTFRGDSLAQARSPNDLDLTLLGRVLGNDHVLLLRRHPAVRAAHPLDPTLGDFVIDVSDHPEINELLLITDILVTDYSSVIFEFSLLGRPMAFFAPDVDDYERNRGFYFNYRLGVPGEVFESSSDLASHLRAGVFDLDRVRAFAATWFDVVDGRATERFVERIVLPALGGSPIHAPA